MAAPELAAADEEAEVAVDELLEALEVAPDAEAAEELQN